MKAIIQRVLAAKVTVAGDVISSIGPGLCVLIGISRTDTEKDVEFIVKKLLSIRLFDGLLPPSATDVASNEAGEPADTVIGVPKTPSVVRWKHNVKDSDFELLCISQFTLCCRLKGTKPDFHLAMGEHEAKTLYDSLLERLRTSYRSDRVHDGLFGAKMVVHIENDGPVTIEVESPAAENVAASANGK